MKIEIVYLRYFAAFVITAFLWFWAAPTCFNVSPLLGAIAFALAPVLDYWLIKPIYKKKPAAEKPAEQYKVKK